MLERIETMMGLSITTWLILAGCAALSLGLLAFHHSVVKNEDNRIIVRTEKHLNQIKGAQDEILNSTPSGHAVAVGMRRGVF